jgi:nucleotide-binding universal stress UspA family protein
MVEPILVPLDGSLLAESVLPHTVAIARALDAQVALLRVLSQHPESESVGPTQSCDPLNWRITKAEAQRYLEAKAAYLGEVGVEVQTKIAEGLVAETITDTAHEMKTSVIILSSHGCSGLSQWGVSGTAHKVILSAPCSIFLVRAHQPMVTELLTLKYHRILVPLDGSQRAEFVLPLAIQLAQFHHAHIHVVHIVRRPEMARRMPPTREDLELSHGIVARNQDEARRYLDTVESRLSLMGVAVQTQLLISDDIASALHGLTTQEAIDLVLLCAHGYSGHSQWPYGSVAENFILYSRAPLLIVQDLPFREDPLRVDVAVREHPGSTHAG